MNTTLVMAQLRLVRMANGSSQVGGRRLGHRPVGRRDQLLFTSGGTESNNVAIFGLSERRPGAIVVSCIEHPSVLAAAQYAGDQGREFRYLPSSSDGVVNLDCLEEWLAAQSTTGPISLVSLMLANNEIGVLQPVTSAAAMCRKAGVLLHTDAV